MSVIKPVTDLGVEFLYIINEKVFMNQVQKTQTIERRFQDTFESVQTAWKKGFLKIGLASATMLLVVTGCSSVDAVGSKTVAIQAGPTSTEIAPVRTFTPEATAIPTHTSTPTEIPSPTETPRIRLTMDMENPVFVTWDKVVANQMESAVTKPFNKDAVVTFRWGDFFDPETNTQQFTSPMSYPDPELRPFRISGYGKTVSPDGKELIIIREDVHNADDSTGHWNFIIDKERFNSDVWVYKFRVELASGEGYLKPFLHDKNTLNDKRYWGVAGWEFELSKQTSPNAMKYYKEYIDSNIVNPDGDNYLWVPIIDYWVQ
jgi:hypothetical protein